MRILSIILISFFILVSGLSADEEGVVVTLDFESGSINPYSVIGLVQGQKLHVRIEGLKDDVAYNISIEGVKADRPESESGANNDRRGDSNGKKEYIIEHDKRYASYTVVVSEGGGAARTWVLPVETLRWQLAFSSAFVANTLTDPVYYLEPGVNSATPGADKNGYFVKENSDAQDNVKLGLAALVHLYHTKKFGNDTIKWAPITFGLGFGEGTKMRYYVGTSLKMGDDFFVTAGVVAGQVNRLPAQLKLENGMNFTRESNILQNLHTKTKVGAFISLSYSFGAGRAKQILMKPFSTTTNVNIPDDREGRDESEID